MDILKTIKFWSENPFFDKDTREKAKQLLSEGKQTEQRECFGSFLEFGTGGMRGIMGVGTNRINLYTIQMATEALAKIVKKKSLKSKYSGVVIGYDSRNSSFEFAKASSQVLASHGIPVYLFRKIAPTPLVSCEILRRKAIAGIIITASHNPPEYNGFKVYSETGGMIVSPEDSQIIEEVYKIDRINEISSINFEKAVQFGKIEWIGDEADEYYLNIVSKLSIGVRENNNKLGIIFTPLHGTGGRLVPKLLIQQGFEKIKLVEKQMIPDGNFSTVESPNPEEEQSFEMALSEASKSDELILANDPDADRLGVMVRYKENSWKWLSGNQIGVLILDYTIRTMKMQNRIPKNGFVISTIVTSPLVSKIAKKNGLTSIEVLTGFKWVRKAALDFEREMGGTFIFGMEESHGFLMGNHSGDKDGIWASMAFAEMTAALKKNQLTPIERLNQIYEEYGRHLDALFTQNYKGTNGIAKINEIMSSIRKTPPKKIGGQEVVKIIDYLEKKTIYENETLKGSELPKSNVISFYLSDDSRVTIRPSGTEPKIKYYFNLDGKESTILKERLLKFRKDFIK